MMNILFGVTTKVPITTDAIKNHLLVKSVIGYTLAHHNKNIQDIIQSSFSKFVKTKILRSNTPSPISLELSHISNLFHIPADSDI